MAKEVPIDTNVLIEIVNHKIQFGKYKGKWMYELPEHYLLWMINNGKLSGKFEMMINTTYIIQSNSLNHLLHPLIQKRNQNQNDLLR